MSKTIKYSAVILFVVTSATWVFALFKHTFLMRELGLYVMIFLIPIVLVLISEWVMNHRNVWRRFVGVLLLIPSLGIWVVALMLVSVGFKIH